MTFDCLWMGKTTMSDKPMVKTNSQILQNISGKIIRTKGLNSFVLDVGEYIYNGTPFTLKKVTELHGLNHLEAHLKINGVIQ